MMPVQEALRTACAEVGIVYREIPADGRWHATDIEGDKRGRGDGRIKMFADGEGGVVYNHKGQSQPFFAELSKPLNRQESEERSRKRLAAIQKAKDEDVRRRLEAANKAANLWKAGRRAHDSHPYLTRKKVKAVQTIREFTAREIVTVLGYTPKSSGEALTGRILLVPVKVGEALSTLELIDEQGRKSAIAGGAKSGGFWAAQPMPDGDGAGLTFQYGEGVATTLSAKEANRHVSIAALSAGNLPAVAKYFRQRYPAGVHVILADLVKATGGPELHAIQAALAVDGLLAVPNFGKDRPEGFSDFNDMAAHCGKDAVKQAIAGAIFPAIPEPMPTEEHVANVDGTLLNNEADSDTLTRGDSITGLIDSQVTDVTVVTANDGAASSVTPDENAGVTPQTDSLIPGENQRPTYKVFDELVAQLGGGDLRPGVWFFGIKPGKGDSPATLIQTWICSPLHIEAVTFDGQQNNFGRMLRFKNTLGKWRTFAMPMELLRAGGDDLRGELLAMGLHIDPSAHQLLGRYLQATTPRRRVHCALQVGWSGDNFVLPDAVIGTGAADVIFQSGERTHAEYTTAGTLADWQSGIAALAVGNPILTLALAASFCGPLLKKTNSESGGLHFEGDSSTGKTTLIEAACATWGGSNYKRSWRSTANGMEGAAAMFNDGLLALDEISECDPKEVGAIVYALGNGRGKQRASRSGAARSVTTWRCFVLSSGERTIATAMQEGGHRAKAGQSVRLLDIPAARKHGAWDDLHGFATGAALSDAIKRAAATHHGYAGRAFLQKLTRDHRNFGEYLEQFKQLPLFSATDGEGQDKRAAGRFALIAMVGELATEYGLTGWTEGAAVESAGIAYELWRGKRGKGNDERRQIVDRVSDFIERNGDGRFSSADNNADAPVRDRAGWWRDNDEGRIYLFNADGMKEALKGFDFRRALDVLQEVGALPKTSGERAKSQRIGERVVKIYPINPAKLGGEHGA